MSGTSSKSTNRSYFLPLTSADDVKKALSTDGPQLLFLRDPWCPISQEAEDEILSLGIAVLTIDVSQWHDLSKLVQQETGIKHESPQAIVIRQGQPAWHASHGRITRASVTEALEAAGAPN